MNNSEKKASKTEKIIGIVVAVAIGAMFLAAIIATIVDNVSIGNFEKSLQQTFGQPELDGKKSDMEYTNQDKLYGYFIDRDGNGKWTKKLPYNASVWESRELLPGIYKAKKLEDVGGVIIITVGGRNDYNVQLLDIHNNVLVGEKRFTPRRPDNPYQGMTYPKADEVREWVKNEWEAYLKTRK